MAGASSSFQENSRLRTISKLSWPVAGCQGDSIRPMTLLSLARASWPCTLPTSSL